MDGIIWNSIGIMAVERVRYIYGEEKYENQLPKSILTLLLEKLCI